MPYGTILDSGSFISNGLAKRIPCVEGASWLNVYNYTVADTAAADSAYQFYWQVGMQPNDDIIYRFNAVGPAVGTVASIRAIAGGAYTSTNGITLIDSSNSMTTTYNGSNIGSITADAIPVVNAVIWTTLLQDGDIVRIYDNIGGTQLSGIDFTVGAVTPGVFPGNGSFTLAYMSQIAATGATGYWRKVFDPYFYPQHRYISKIAIGADPTTTLVTLTVTNNYQIGQQVRFIVPRAYGMTQLNEVQATIIAMGIADADGVTNTILVNTSVAGFTPFVFPLSGFAFSPAMVVPIGMNTSEALYPVLPLPPVPPYDNLTDATLNTASRYLLLGAGAAGQAGGLANSPAGTTADVIYWTLGTSYNL